MSISAVDNIAYNINLCKQLESEKTEYRLIAAAALVITVMVALIAFHAITLPISLPIWVLGAVGTAGLAFSIFSAAKLVSIPEKIVDLKLKNIRIITDLKGQVQRRITDYYKWDATEIRLRRVDILEKARILEEELAKAPPEPHKEEEKIARQEATINRYHEKIYQHFALKLLDEVSLCKEINDKLYKTNNFRNKVKFLQETILGLDKLEEEFEKYLDKVATEDKK